jgi:hypothetical protein
LADPFRDYQLRLSNGVPLSIRTRKTVPRIGNGNGNAEKTKDHLFISGYVFVKKYIFLSFSIIGMQGMKNKEHSLNRKNRLNLYCKLF